MRKPTRLLLNVSALPPTPPSPVRPFLSILHLLSTTSAAIKAARVCRSFATNENIDNFPGSCRLSQPRLCEVRRAILDRIGLARGTLLIFLPIVLPSWQDEKPVNDDSPFWLLRTPRGETGCNRVVGAQSRSCGRRGG